MRDPREDIQFSVRAALRPILQFLSIPCERVKRSFPVEDILLPLVDSSHASVSEMARNAVAASINAEPLHVHLQRSDFSSSTDAGIEDAVRQHFLDWPHFCDQRSQVHSFVCRSKGIIDEK